MKKKNILILVYESEIFNSIEAARILQNKYNITFFCCDWFTSLSETNKKIIQHSDINYDYIFDIKKEILELNNLKENGNIKINYDYISNIENSLLNEKVCGIGLKDYALNNIDSPRLHYYHPTNKNIINKYFEIILRKFKTVVNFKNYQFIYSAGTANLVRNIFLSYCRKNKISFFVPRQRFELTYLADCSMNSSNLAYLIKNKSVISKKNNFIYNKSISILNHFEPFNLLVLLEFLLNSFNKFLGLIRDDFKKRVKFSRPNYFQEKNRLFIILHIIKDSFNKFLIQRYIQKNLKNKIRIIKNKKFIYFPLHIIPEGGVFDQNDYVDEFFFIYELSKLIPANYKILVKPHPDLFKCSESIYPLSWYKRINKLSNVEILPQYINNDFLLKHCITTVSIAGTPSIESAVFYNKISFVIGDVELNGLKNLFKYNKLLFKRFIDGLFFFSSRSLRKNYEYNIKILNSLKLNSINCENNSYHFSSKKTKYKNIHNEAIDTYVNFVFPDKAYSQTDNYKKKMKKFLGRIL